MASQDNPEASQTTSVETQEISTKIQVSAPDKPLSNFSGDQSPPISAQSAARLTQEIPLYPLQTPPSRSPDIQIPTPVEARSRPRQDTQFIAYDNRPTILSRPSIQPSTSGYVQFRTREDMELCSSEGAQSQVLSNNRAMLDRPSSSNPGHVIAEELRVPPQARTVAIGSDGPASTPLDWIVPVDDKCHVNRTITVSERLGPTLSKAKTERNIFSAKAKMAGWTLNVAIFLQVLLGSLTTGVAAGNGKEVFFTQAAIGTTILGALSTIVASFLARARGSGEPELSVTRVKDLEQFIREVDSFLLDHGNSTSNDHDEQLHKFRMRFEELLGNMT
ncbi:hypothetical protein C0993_006598, partial [Termitomyces sp. T159_Od127]